MITVNQVFAIMYSSLHSKQISVLFLGFTKIVYPNLSSNDTFKSDIGSVLAYFTGNNSIDFVIFLREIILYTNTKSLNVA